MSPAVLTTEGIREVGMIQNVKHFNAELSTEAFAEFPILGNRQIDVAEARIAKNVASHDAEGTRNGRQHG